MNNEVNKHGNPGNRILVEVNVANIVKYICVTSVIIVSIVLGAKVLMRIFSKESNNLL